jgi:hypothetical protein
MLPLARRLALSASIVLAVGCATPREAGPVAAPRDVITRAEILAANSQTVYQIVERLHPNWLQKRGQHGLGADEDIVVYLDNARLGGPASLQQIPISSVVSVQFFDAGRAQYRFGTGHSYGAILVSTGAR